MSDLLEDDYKGVGVNGNLRPATIGEVRNPRGKPPGTRNRSTIAKEWLKALGTSEDGKQLPYEDLITLAAIKKAMTGDISAYTALNDNAYGKLTDKLEANVTSNPVGDILNGIDGTTAGRPAPKPTE